MAVPKKRHSNSRTGKRRAHDALKSVASRMNNLIKCPKCGEKHLAHRLCPCSQK